MEKKDRFFQMYRKKIVSLTEGLNLGLWMLNKISWKFYYIFSRTDLTPAPLQKNTAIRQWRIERESAVGVKNLLNFYTVYVEIKIFM